MSGGTTDSTKHIFLRTPDGRNRNLKRVVVLANPRVADGSEIFISRKVPKPEKEKKEGPSVGEVLRDIFTVVASGLTIVLIIMQIQKS
jgi:hypothetical protein